ncbi:MAG: ABC transporter permease subunit [Planctomycetes bacterium]|nr:ABC transporter permease subunit [Planctomycetota bacterium]
MPCRIGTLCLLLIAANCSSVALAAKLGHREPLRWGGDQEGGGPYIFARDDDPTRVIGFEVDLAEVLARRIGRNAQFVQCEWEQILPVLTRGNIDVALNGYEYNDQRASRYLCSLPYYIFELGLCVNSKRQQIRTWDDLQKTKPDGTECRVGVLGGSAADRYVTEVYGARCQVIRFKGSTEAMWQVEAGQIDATVQDLPILNFYVEHLHRYPELDVVDQPAARGYYVMYVRSEEPRLLDQLNFALRTLRETGELREIYERYGIWNTTQEDLDEVWAGWHTGLRANRQGPWETLRQQIPLLLKAAAVTVALAVTSMPLAILIGLCVALVRSWNHPALGGGTVPLSFLYPPLRWLCTLYVELIRGTPLAFQLLVVYFILPKVGVRIDNFWAGVLALAVNYSAYEAEIFRLGLQAVPRGQIEAALSLGMSRPLAVRRIILPQAVRIVIPATANDFIALFKDTAVCSVIAVNELSKQYSLGANTTGLFLQMAAVASILYLAMSYPLSLLAGLLERKFRHDLHAP